MFTTKVAKSTDVTEYAQDCGSEQPDTRTEAPGIGPGAQDPPRPVPTPPWASGAKQGILGGVARVGLA